MKEITMFFPGIMMILLGIAIGMYISSQIKCHIRSRINNKRSSRMVRDQSKNR